MAAVDVSGGEVIHLVVKAEGDAVPPWLLVANSLKTNLAVASWLEEGYGGPSICLGDDYSRATRLGCLVDANVSLGLRHDGGAAYSVENALAASVTLDGVERAWGLWGDLRLPITSHAKYGVGSTAPWFVSGDMNQQGWPCSKDCSGSQLGRGGTFLGMYGAELHSSVAKILHLVCACDSASQKTQRFCNFGCFRKLQPPGGMPKQDTSPWDDVGWGEVESIGRVKRMGEREWKASTIYNERTNERLKVACIVTTLGTSQYASCCVTQTSPASSRAPISRLALRWPRRTL